MNTTNMYSRQYIENYLIDQWIFELLNSGKEDTSQYSLDVRENAKPKVKDGIISPRHAYEPTKSAFKRSKKAYKSTTELKPAGKSQIYTEIMELDLKGEMRPSGIYDGNSTTLSIKIDGATYSVERSKMIHYMFKYVIDVQIIPYNSGEKVFALIEIPTQLLIDNSTVR